MGETVCVCVCVCLRGGGAERRGREGGRVYVCVCVRV